MADDYTLRNSKAEIVIIGTFDLCCRFMKHHVPDGD